MEDEDFSQSGEKQCLICCVLQDTHEMEGYKTLWEVWGSSTKAGGRNEAVRGAIFCSPPGAFESTNPHRAVPLLRDSDKNGPQDEVNPSSGKRVLQKYTMKHHRCNPWEWRGLERSSASGFSWFTWDQTIPEEAVPTVLPVNIWKVLFHHIFFTFHLKLNWHKGASENKGKKNKITSHLWWVIQRRNKTGLSLVCIAFLSQSLSFILALSSMTFQALLGCSKINKASFRALGKTFLSAIPEACCLTLPPGSLSALICAASPCFELPGQVTLHRSPLSLCPKSCCCCSGWSWQGQAACSHAAGACL